jgi:hypothetical protein
MGRLVCNAVLGEKTLKPRVLNRLIDQRLTSQVLFVLHASFAITGIHHGTGQHAWNIQPTEIPIGLKVSHWSLYCSQIEANQW